MDLRAYAKEAGFAAAGQAAGERIRPGGLTPARLRGWAGALAELHALPLPDDAPASVFPDWPALLPDPRPVDMAPLLWQASSQHAPPPPPARSVLCHGRFWLANCRFDGDRLAAVSDWQDAGRGDPAHDIAGVEVGLLAAGSSAAAAEAFVQAFLAAYAEAGGAPIAGLAAWRLACAGERLARCLDARRRPAVPGQADLAAQTLLWARQIARLLARPPG